MARLTGEQLEALMKKEGVDRIWSWSKINCFHTSPYEYYLRYILKAKEDRADSIYTTTGGIAHDILEKFYTKHIRKDMKQEIIDAGYDIQTEAKKLQELYLSLAENPEDSED